MRRRRTDTLWAFFSKASSTNANSLSIVLSAEQLTRFSAAWVSTPRPYGNLNVTAVNTGQSSLPRNVNRSCRRSPTTSPSAAASLLAVSTARTQACCVHDQMVNRFIGMPQRRRPGTGRCPMLSYDFPEQTRGSLSSRNEKVQLDQVIGRRILAHRPSLVPGRSPFQTLVTSKVRGYPSHHRAGEHGGIPTDASDFRPIWAGPWARAKRAQAAAASRRRRGETPDHQDEIENHRSSFRHPTSLPPSLRDVRFDSSDTCTGTSTSASPTPTIKADACRPTAAAPSTARADPWRDRSKTRCGTLTAPRRTRRSIGRPPPGSRREP